MKKTILLILIIFAFNITSRAATWNVLVEDFSFTPANLFVSVGDTIVWTWGNGTHTTTSTSVPSTALTWDSPITASEVTFQYIVTVPGSYNYQCTRHALMNMVGAITAQPLSVSQIGTTVTSYELRQNYPNPFNPATTISFSIPKSGQVRVSVYNVLGREVSILVNENMNAGVYNVKFDASKLSSGIYFYKIDAEDFSSIKRMTLLK